MCGYVKVTTFTLSPLRVDERNQRDREREGMTKKERQNERREKENESERQERGGDGGMRHDVCTDATGMTKNNRLSIMKGDRVLGRQIYILTGGNQAVFKALSVDKQFDRSI